MVEEMTRVEEQDKNKGYILAYEIDESMPDEIHQVKLIADLTEEEYLGFEGMCDFALNAY